MRSLDHVPTHIESFSEQKIQNLRQQTHLFGESQMNLEKIHIDFIFSDSGLSSRLLPSLPCGAAMQWLEDVCDGSCRWQRLDQTVCTYTIKITTSTNWYSAAVCVFKRKCRNKIVGVVSMGLSFLKFLSSNCSRRRWVKEWSICGA